MNFFKLEDFETRHFDQSMTISEWCVIIANAKLEKEALRVYGYQTGNAQGTSGCPRRFWQDAKHQMRDGPPDTVALLIMEEPLVKCAHPFTKIRQIGVVNVKADGFNPGIKITEISYECECGVKVKPVKFDEEK